MINAKQLDRVSLLESVQAAIRDYILNHELSPGDPLPSQDELAKALGVSRTSVREAMRALEALGILEVRHGTGVFARDVNLDALSHVLSYGLVFQPSRLLDVFRARRLLETSMIPEVVQRIQPKDLEISLKILEEWESNADSGSSLACAEQDMLFHQALYQVMDNQFILQFIGACCAAQVRAQTRMDIMLTASEKGWIDRHRKILQAVEARNEDLAVQAVFEHFQEAEKVLKSVLNDIAGDQEDEQNNG